MPLYPWAFCDWCLSPMRYVSKRSVFAIGRGGPPYIVLSTRVPVPRIDTVLRNDVHLGCSVLEVHRGEPDGSKYSRPGTLGFYARLSCKEVFLRIVYQVAQPARADLRAAEKQLFGIFTHTAQAYWNIKVFGATRGDTTIARK
jgi:hypothetical protein